VLSDDLGADFPVDGRGEGRKQIKQMLRELDLFVPDND
jgi:hypothetical protein